MHIQTTEPPSLTEVLSSPFLSKGSWSHICGTTSDPYTEKSMGSLWEGSVYPLPNFPLIPYPLSLFEEKDGVGVT